MNYSRIVDRLMWWRDQITDHRVELYDRLFDDHKAGVSRIMFVPEAPAWDRLNKRHIHKAVKNFLDEHSESKVG